MALLEGLEAVEYNFKEVFENDNFGRIDAEYYGKHYISLNSILSNNKFKRINEIAIVTDGEHGSPDLDSESGIIYLSGNNIKENIIDFENVRYCSLKLHQKNLRSELKENNVLMSIVGTVGKASIVSKDIIANTDRNVATIKKISKEINPYWLSVFLNSRYGAFQTKRYSTGNVQPLLNLLQVKSIKVPLFSLKFQKEIESSFKYALSKTEESRHKYIIAQSLLLETIGLKNFKPSTDPINIKNFKESFLATGRIDSEYYQKKYEEVVNHIKEQKHDSLSNIVKIKKSIEPGSHVYSDEGLPFLRVADYNKFGINSPEKKLSNSFCKSNKDLIKDLKPKKETILFSKDGTLGLAYMLRKDEEMITSGAILHLTVKDKTRIIPEYLTLALNSILVQMQAERDSGGSIIQHWRINEIENVIVPIIDYKKQQKIAELVEESFKLKKQSEHLLETAKRAVEIAIEQNEEKAKEFINQNIE